MDPQGHCATGLGVPEKSIDRSVAEALVAAHDPALDTSSLAWEVSRNLDLVPSTVRLAALEAPGGGLHQLPDRDRRLAMLLSRFRERYDRMIVDCPPNIGLLTFNALRAVRETIIPVQTEFFALRGADRQWQTIRQLVERIGRPIACHIVPAMYDEDSRLATEILTTLRQQFAGQVVPVVIHEEDKVREAASFGQPITEYAPDSQACKDFEALADWLEAHEPAAAPEIEILASRVPASPGTHAGTRNAGSPSVSVSSRTAPEIPGGTLGRAAELARMVRGFQSSRADVAATAPPPLPDLDAPVELRAPAPVLPAIPAIPPISALQVAALTAAGSSRFGVRTTPEGVAFTQPGEPATNIAIAGEFNGWSPSATPLSYDAAEGAHRALVRIPPGKYQYQVVIDGRWHADRHNVHKRINAYEEANSLLFVPDPAGPHPSAGPPGAPAPPAAPEPSPDRHDPHRRSL